MAVRKAIWRNIWPPRVDDAAGAIARLQRTPRGEWTGDDWRTWAEFLEQHGRQLTEELNEVRAVAADLAAKVPTTKRGRKPKPKPSTLAGGLLGLVRVPLPRQRKSPGRRADLTEAEQREARRVQVEARMAETGLGREAALREIIKADSPWKRNSRVRDEARNEARRLWRAKPAR